MTYEVEQVELIEQPAAVVSAQVAMSQIAEFLGGAFGEVIAVLSAQGIEPAGAPFALYSPPSEEGFAIRAGFPTSAPVTAAGRVEPLTLPGGPGLRVMHVGSYDAVAGAYRAIEEYMDANSLGPADAPRESYLDEPGVEQPRTVVEWPVRPI